MPTKKVRKICWKCRSKIIIEKTIKLMSKKEHYGADKIIEQYWCIECTTKLKNYLNELKCLTGEDTK